MTNVEYNAMKSMVNASNQMFDAYEALLQSAIQLHEANIHFDNSIITKLSDDLSALGKYVQSLIDDVAGNEQERKK